MSKRVIAITATFHALSEEVFAASCSAGAFPSGIKTRLLGTCVAQWALLLPIEMNAEQFEL
jgi:hypothetical protein